MPSRKSKTSKKSVRKNVKASKKSNGKKTVKAKSGKQRRAAKVKTDRSKPTGEIASIFSVADRTVHNWVKRGCPHTKGKAPLGNRFDEHEVAAWLKSNNIETCKPGRPIEGDSTDLRAARLRKENALAAKYELEVDRARDQLFDASMVRSAWAHMITVTRNKLLGFASAIAPLFPDVASDLEDELDRRIKEVLFELSNTELPASAA